MDVLTIRSTDRAIECARYITEHALHIILSESLHSPYLNNRIKYFPAKRKSPSRNHTTNLTGNIGSQEPALEQTAQLGQPLLDQATCVRSISQELIAPLLPPPLLPSFISNIQALARFLSFLSCVSCLPILLSTFRDPNSPHMKYFLSTVVLVTFACQATAQKCYSTDGSKLDSRYQPCFPQAEHSACCMLNGTQGDNQQNDICMDSGLCQATSGWYAGFLYINGCTDPANDAEGCPKLCSFSMFDQFCLRRLNADRTDSG